MEGQRPWGLDPLGAKDAPKCIFWFRCYRIPWFNRKREGLEAVSSGLRPPPRTDRLLDMLRSAQVPIAKFSADRPGRLTGNGRSLHADLEVPFASRAALTGMPRHQTAERGIEALLEPPWWAKSFGALGGRICTPALCPFSAGGESDRTVRQGSQLLRYARWPGEFDLRVGSVSWLRAEAYRS